jgi:site-specific recombinase XerD
MSVSSTEQGTIQFDIRAFLLDRRARGLSAGAVEFYRKKLRYLSTYLDDQDIYDLRDITPDHLRRYVADLSTRHNPGGVHCCFRAMRTFLRWAWEEYEIAAPCPMLRLHAPRLAQEPPEPVPLEDIRAMLSMCKPRTFLGDRDRALLLALLDSGCRAAEFLALDVRDVDLETGAVIIRAGKGGKFRVAYLGHRARRELVRYLRHHDDSAPLWVTVDGRRLTYPGLRQIVRRRAIRAGIAVPSLHSFRRGFALSCLRSGMDVYSLQKLMGHADLSVLKRYLALAGEDLQRAHREHGPVDRLLNH